MPREFIEFPGDGPPTPAELATVVELFSQSQEQQGRILAMHRAWPGNWGWVWAFFPYPALAILEASAPPWEWWFLLGMWVPVAVIWTLPILIAGYWEKHRICEHGLALGIKRRTRFMVPYSTIDPGRVRVVQNVNLAGRYYGPGVTQRYRGFYAQTPGVILNGLDTTKVKPAPWNIGGGAMPSSPFGTWFIGTRRPEEFVQQLEAAMVADGYPADGLAERAIRGRKTLHMFLRNAFHEKWPPTISPHRDLRDPVLGVNAPV